MRKKVLQKYNSKKGRKNRFKDLIKSSESECLNGKRESAKNSE